MKDLPKEPLDLILSFIPADPAAALQRLLPEISFAEVAPVMNPTVAQLKAVRELEPYAEVGLSEIKRQLTNGLVRFGPQLQAMLRDIYLPRLEAVGLQATIRPATLDELKTSKLVEDCVPEYFRELPNGPQK